MNHDETVKQTTEQVVLKSGVAGIMKENRDLTLFIYISVLLNIGLLLYIFSSCYE